MSELAIHPSSPIALPEPRVPITIRVATMADLPFMDRLQKQHGKALGYFPTKQFEGYIAMGGVLVAEMQNAKCEMQNEDERHEDSSSILHSAFRNSHFPLPLGYVISRDRYLKRDELGVVYQLCVSPGQQRSYIGAALLQAVFERAAYGCRLFCCWCAQDLPANRFWESMGFVPIAFRTGGRGRLRNADCGLRNEDKDGASSNPKSAIRNPQSPRVHIFWQKRIRQGDTTTPWWFPSKTESGALRADRLVLPIPPGVRWDQVEPVVTEDRVPGSGSRVPGEKRRPRASSRTPDPGTRTPRSPVQFGRPGAVAPVSADRVSSPAGASVGGRRPPKEKRPQPRCDPKLVAAARELRDRWLEQVNADPALLKAGEKYQVARLASPVGPHPSPLPEGEGARALLTAA